MKFKSVCIFITTLASVLNVAFTSYVQDLDLSDTISNRLRRETVSIDEQRNKCYEEYTLKTDDFLAQVKKRSLECDNIAESAKSQFDVLSQKARVVFQSLVADKMKSTPADNLQKCSEKTSAAEYFQCVRSYETAQREFLDEINEKSRDHFSELKKIEENRRHCLKQVIDKNKSNSATLSLERCLDQISDPSSSTPKSQLKDEMSENLTQLKNIYYELKNCTRNGEEGFRFDDCLYQTNKDVKLKYLSEHAAEYFPHLNEIDSSEDICVRHLAAQFVSGNRYDEEIFKCFQRGRANSSYPNAYEITQLKKLSKLLADCKYVHIVHRARSKDCFDEALAGYKFDFYTILDEDIERTIAFTDVEEDDRNCLRFALKKFQYDGLFLKNSDEQGFKECFYS